VGGFIWEIPAGTLDPGEDARQCAARELTEETGYEARSLEKLAEITPLPAYSDERIHLFLAGGLVRAVQQLDRDELLVVHAVDLGRALQMISDGEIQDAKTIAGLQLAVGRLSGCGEAESISQSPIRPRPGAIP
jgi:ADP-ribose pyrophosphatase